MDFTTICGTVFENKVYVISTQTKECLKCFADKYFSDDAKVIFYDEFYIKNEYRLIETNVVSKAMLKEIFSLIYPSLVFVQTYFGYTNDSIYKAIETEILRVWGDNVLMSYTQLSEQLAYIPVERIKNIFSQNSDFIWNRAGEFAQIGKFDIAKDEVSKVISFVEREVLLHEYVSILDTPLGEIPARNHQLTTTAIHNAIYYTCLDANYDKLGKIITRKGNGVNALHIMMEY